MPTVIWTPRFINYTPTEDECNTASTIFSSPNARKRGKLASSAITNILPRMTRLDGPYGMYATVYGVSTKVVHVGHPVPAREILAGMGKANEEEGTEKRWSNVVFCYLQSLMSKVDTYTIHRRLRRSSSLIMNTTGSTKNPAYDHFKNFSGEGVFTANGSDWKAKRASVLHCLLGNINELEKEANKSANGLLDEVKLIRENERNSLEDVVNVVPLLQRCTIGLIYRIITDDHDAFRPDLVRAKLMNNCEKIDGSTDTATTSSPRSSATSLASMEVAPNTDTNAKAISNYVNIIQSNKCRQQQPSNFGLIQSLLPTYLRSVTQIRMIILAQSRSIWYLLPRWAYRLFSPMYREEERVMGPIREFARLVCQNAKLESPLKLLSKRASHNKNTMPLSDGGISKDMLDEAITLLFAGQDTSAATLSWTLHLLSLDPLKQQRLVAEVRSVMQSHNDSGKEFITKSMISQMPYLDAVIKESMRLYPVAPFVVRKLTSDITIPPENRSNEKSSTTLDAEATTGTTLPSSTFACIWIYALHRNPKLWHSPEEFIPERWIDPNLRCKDAGQEEPGAYIPFAMGPRNCLGRPLAQVILRVLLARILNEYTVVDPRYEAMKDKLKGEGDIKCLRKDMQAGFTVLPSNGLMLKFIENKQ